MEKTVLEQKETYVDSVHRWGRIWGLTLLVLIVAYPIAVSLIFHAQVNWAPRSLRLYRHRAYVLGRRHCGNFYLCADARRGRQLPVLQSPATSANLKLPCALDAMEQGGRQVQQ